LASLLLSKVTLIQDKGYGYMARYLAHTYLIENIEKFFKNISIFKNQTINEIKNILKIFSDVE
jgi:hypothetical protein